MEVVFDGKTGPVATPGITTYRDLFESLHRLAREQSRVILSMKLDGVPLSLEAQTGMAAERLPEGGRLEVGTMDRRRLAVETVEALLGQLPGLEKSHQEAAEQMIGANYRTAMIRFQECFEGWGRMMTAIGSVASGSALNLGTLSSGGKPVAQEFQKIQETLTRFKSAFEQSDVVRLADITQYDLKPLLEGCRSVLEALRRRLLDPLPGAR